MNILKKAASYFTRELSVVDPDGWRDPQTPTRAGMDATPSASLGLSATWACVNLIAGTIGSLPCMVYRTDKTGVRTVAKDHWLYSLMHNSPNFDQTAVDYWEFMSASIELHGDGYAEKVRGAEGAIVALEPLRPDTMGKRRLDNGDIEYRWTHDGRQRVETQDNVLHIRGPFGGPLGGASTLAVCRNVFGAAIATDEASSQMFAKGALPSGVLSTDKPLTAEQRKTLEALLQEKFVGAQNAGRPMLLDNALNWQQITLNPEDAQMLETRQFGVEEICRVFGVPPHMVGQTAKSTSFGTGIEAQTLRFQKFTLRRRLKRIEQACEKQLLSPADRAAGITIEFNIEGLLRGDSKARADFYREALTNGWMSVNEVRTLENLPPVEGGNVNRVQMQNVPLIEAGAEDQP
ncbi:phage portal protein [Algimonas porphyrae]|uniref:Portal protein n=1 Tax=Algimonas porphyrae TaxID=1128113 RepID=A0ABQ5UZ11_9PROT|nr:phage portal protein [Algimonas porphyrae]GLQ20383.1 portal protein [Algimonas porphyrae]